MTTKWCIHTSIFPDLGDKTVVGLPIILLLSATLNLDPRNHESQSIQSQASAAYQFHAQWEKEKFLNELLKLLNNGELS